MNLIIGKDKEEFLNLKKELEEKNKEIELLTKKNMYLTKVSDEGLQHYINLEYAKIIASSTKICIIPNIGFDEDKKQLLFEVFIKYDDSIKKVTLFKDCIDLINVYENTKRIAMYNLLKDTCKFSKKMFELHKQRNLSQCEISIIKKGLNKELKKYFEI